MKKIYILINNGKKQQILSIFNKIMYLCKKIQCNKKYPLQEKFLFQQLVANFSNFWQNNSILCKKNHIIKIAATRKVHLCAVVANFNYFRQNNSVIYGGKNTFRKIKHEKSFFDNLLHKLEKTLLELRQIPSD